MTRARPDTTLDQRATKNGDVPEMTQVKASDQSVDQYGLMWNPIASAPFGPSLQLAVLDQDGAHVLVFPCRKEPMGWKNASTGARVDVHPTHWRLWDRDESDLAPMRNPN